MSTVRPGPHERHLALTVTLTAVIAFAVTAPFATLPLGPVPSFLPIYQTTVVFANFVTFVMLLGQYDILRSRGLFALTCGFLFSAAMGAMHALSFPGLFSDTGLLQANTQTTAWLYFFWHGGFPLFLIAHATLDRFGLEPPRRRVPLGLMVAVAVLVVSLLVTASVYLATRGAGWLPSLMDGDTDANAKFHVALLCWGIGVVALLLLWRRRPHALLDLWLMVILVIWILDLALAAVLNGARYDLGWYAGRIYGLVAASFVLFLLLLRNGKLHALLASTNAKERAYLNHLHDPVVTIDARGRIINANPALETVLGYPAAEVLGENVAMLMHEPDRSMHGAHLRSYLRTGKANVIGKRREVMGRHRNGDAIPLELSVSEFLHEGERLYIGSLRDLRERNQLIDALQQARIDAEQANRAKSAFLATMSHEIRTPMNGVVGMIEVLAHSKLSTHQADLLGTMRDSAFTLLTLIDDILDFSKIEAGRLDLDLQPTSVFDLVEGLCNSLSTVASNKRVDLDLFIAPHLPETVLADEVRLRQIIYNLVGNAIKFSARQGDTRGRVYVRVEPNPDAPSEMRIRVEDDGIGMSPDALARLFRPFTQAEVSTTRLFGGTGLGLAICNRLVGLMGGRIKVASQQNLGSAFTVLLPLAAAPDAPQRERPAVDGVRCILVNDGSFGAQDLSAYLRHGNATVDIVATLEAATQLAGSMAGGTVVLIHGGRAGHAQGSDPPAPMPPQVQQLILQRGRRRRARVSSPGVVHLDCDALRRDALLQAVGVAAARIAPETVSPEVPARVVAGGDASPQPTGVRRPILVAEDDPTNRQVIVQQLALLGYTAELATNGIEALDLWRTGRHALLITDLHMPEMDGYALASAIRQAEAHGRRLPIIALSANALRGEASKVRSAGMDEYLTKPVKLEVLQAALTRWSGAGRSVPVDAADAHQNTIRQRQDRAVLDVDTLASLVGEDDETLRRFLRQFASAARTAMSDLREAADRSDLEALSAIAHRLKSSARSVGAEALGQFCADLEDAAGEGDRTLAMACLDRLLTTAGQVTSHIGDLLSPPHD